MTMLIIVGGVNKMEQEEVQEKAEEISFFDESMLPSFEIDDVINFEPIF